MKVIMVVFSATSITEEIAQFAINSAVQEQAKLIFLDVRDKDISRKVSQMAGDIGFMGTKIVDDLKKQIKHERDWVIEHILKKLQQEAEEKGIESEIEVIKGPFANNIIKIAKEKGVTTLIIQNRLKDAIKDAPFKVIRLTS